MTDTPAGLGSELLAFLGSHIQSIRQLEVLLWLYAHRDRSWSAAEIARELCANELATARWLEAFRCAQILVLDGAPGRYLFQSTREKEAQLIGKIAAEYKVRPFRVIDAIVNQPTKRMLDLMDAFRFKRGDDDDT